MQPRRRGICPSPSLDVDSQTSRCAPRDRTEEPRSCEEPSPCPSPALRPIGTERRRKIRINKTNRLLRRGSRFEPQSAQDQPIPRSDTVLLRLLQQTRTISAERERRTGKPRNGDGRRLTAHFSVYYLDSYLSGATARCHLLVADPTPDAIPLSLDKTSHDGRMVPARPEDDAVDLRQEIAGYPPQPESKNWGSPERPENSRIFPLPEIERRRRVRLLSLNSRRKQINSDLST